MSRRRAMLLLALLVLVSTAAKQVGATETEIEAQGYGGTASGGWACGPDARVKYGGVAGTVRARIGDTPSDALVLEAGGAVEHRDYARIPCEGGCSGDAPSAAVPSPSTMGGAGMKLGYDWEWAGFRAGA